MAYRWSGSFCVYLCVLLALVMLSAPSGFAQRITSDILGVVYDSGGAVIPGATVKLRSLGTGRELTTETSSVDGSYSFANLPPGRYELTTENTGFKTQVITDVNLSIDQRARVNFTLELGEITTTVEVSAGGAVLLQTETSELADVVDNRRIIDLPLKGRSYVQLGATTAGVIGGNELISNSENWTGRKNISLWIAGQREIQTSFLVDGIETRNDRFGSAGFNPNIDMIQEFKLTKNAGGSEFGNDSAAVVHVSTKAGTNGIHGTAYEFFRNDKLTARNFFDVGDQRPPLRFNDFGGSIGGPIVKNKLFYFGSVEIVRQRRSATQKGLFPSQAQLSGNLADNSSGTGVSTEVVDPFDNNQPFPNNVIPAGRISRFSSTYQEFFPVTNDLSQAPQFNRILALSRLDDSEQFSARIDHNVSDSDTVFYRYIWTDETQLRPSLVFLGGVDKPQSAQNFALGWTHILGPSVVNTFHGGYNRSINAHQPEGTGGIDYAKEVFGLRNTSTCPCDFGLPRAAISGFSSVGSSGLNIGSNQQLFQFTDTVNIVRGRHTIRFGGEFRRMRYFQVTNSPGKPSLVYSGRYSGAALGDFLLGIPVTATQSIGDSTQNIRVSYVSTYFSDSFKVRPNLTLNFGLRWEYKTPPTEINDRQAVFDFQQQKILLAGVDIKREIFDRDFKNFGPQVGFAYTFGPRGNTVFRGGAGVYWVQQETNEYQFLVLTPPFTRASSHTSTGAVPTLSDETLFPAVEIGGPGGNAFPFTRDRNERRPYSPQWNFTLQHQFMEDWSVEASYVGNASVRYGTYGQVNAAREDPTGLLPFAERVPYPGFAGILLATSNGHGHYHAGQFSLTKRFSQGLSLLANYTYARSIDDSSSELNFTYRPEEGRKDMRGPSDFDINHRVVVSYLYEIPLGKGRPFLNQGGVANAVLGGWAVSGISTFMSGPPAQVHLPGNWAVRGPILFTRPDCVSNPNQSSIRSNVRNNGLQYFNPRGFQLPPPFLLGNCGRNTLRSAGINNFDMAFHKQFELTERVSLQARFEFFNIFNHAQWMPFAGGSHIGYGEPGFGNPTFGLVTRARDGRDIQFGLKLIF